MTQQELDDLQAKALEQFKSGTPLFGKGGAFAPMLKVLLIVFLFVSKVMLFRKGYIIWERNHSP